MSALTRRESRGLFPDLFDWLEPSYPIWHPFAGQSMRTEEYIDNGRFVVRAEMPGIDPDKEAEVTTSKGVLTIHAERHEETEGKHHSEFRYGSFTRRVALPDAADESDIQAVYDKGIIEVSIGLKEKAGAENGHRVPITMARHIQPT